MLETLDGPGVRVWARAALAALGRAREEIDALNVFPVPDADTGTNLFLTFESACESLDALAPTAGEGGASGAAAALNALAAGALKGAHGNSGVILSQLLRGLADEVSAAAREGRPAGPKVLAAAFVEASELAWQAVGIPVDGTILSVARAGAEAAGAVADTSEPTFTAVAEAARDAAESALDHTPEQLAVLRENGVVDAGGRGLCILLEVLAALFGGYDPQRAVRAHRVNMRASQDGMLTPRGPAFEVIYLVDATAAKLAELRAEIEALCADGAGDSLVIAGGNGVYRVHVHIDQPGPAIEAAIRLGRPYDLRITSLAECAEFTRAAHPAGVAGVASTTADASAMTSALSAADQSSASANPTHTPHPTPTPGRVVLAAAPGPGIAELFEQAGAVALRCQPGRPPTSAQLTRAVLDSAVAEVIVLVNDANGLAAASAAAEQVHRGGSGVRVAVVPSKAVVQGIAALAVHEPGRRFDADIVAMTAAAGATRHGALQIAADDAWTMAGVCHAGDVLGLIEDDVALIAASVRDAAFELVDRMVSAGGEMVTLVTGDGLGGYPAEDLVEDVTARVHARRPEMDVIAYDGGQSGWPLLIGVE